MRAGSLLASGDGFDVADVRCTDARRGFDAPEETAGHALVFVRRGAFVRRAGGREVLLDSTMAYLTVPGGEQQCAHPVGVGDACIVIGLSDDLAGSLAGGEPHALPAVPMDVAGEFAVRRVAALARAGDIDGELAEQVVRTMAALVARVRPELADCGRHGDAARARLAGQAREILLAEPGLGLLELARRVGYSPHYLSRVFGRVTGSSISAYRNRIRVSRALERLGQGERSLAALACELGFADHAHLTRTIHAVTGHTPTAVRRYLAAHAPC